MAALNTYEFLLDGESAEHYEALLNDYIALYCPGNAPELNLIEQIASAQWRLGRIPVMEKALFDAELARIAAEPGRASDLAQARLLAFAALANTTALGRIDVLQKRLHRACALAEKQLDELQSLRRVRESQAAAAEAAADAAADAAAEAAAEEEAPETAAAEAEWESQVGAPIADHSSFAAPFELAAAAGSSLPVTVLRHDTPCLRDHPVA